MAGKSCRQRHGTGTGVSVASGAGPSAQALEIPFYYTAKQLAEKENSVN